MLSSEVNLCPLKFPLHWASLVRSSDSHREWIDAKLFHFCVSRNFIQPLQLAIVLRSLIMHGQMMIAPVYEQEDTVVTDLYLL